MAGIWARWNEWQMRHWRWVAVAAWLIFCAYLLALKWTQIRGFGLGDTDDNMRMAQVRDLMHGQPWYDLRQHRLDPVHGGANIHWSHLVDLPLIGLILLGRLFMSGPAAEQFAIALAPLIPLLLLFVSLMLVVRRLVAPAAAPLAIATFVYCGSTQGMFYPTRIDHHGWQLALLMLAVAGMTDPVRRRGGLVTGLATALSLTIGLEMIIYAAIMGAATVLFWIEDEGERARMLAYAASLAAGTALGFLIFASNDNWFAVCDALSPVWLSDALLAGAMLVGLSLWREARWQRRLMAAAAVGVVLVAFHALAWPRCLSRLEGMTPDEERLWLRYVREARPLWKHGAEIAWLVISVPLAALLGWSLLLRRVWDVPDQRRRVLAAIAPGLAAIALLAWQTRVGPASEALAIPGAVAVIALLFPQFFRHKNSVVMVIGSFVAVLVGLGAAIPLVFNALPIFPAKKVSAYERKVNRANRLCPMLAALKPIAQQPRGTIFTFVDLAPRLMSVTGQSAIAGPYHRNAQAIVDANLMWRGSADQAHQLVQKYRADYVLTCPDLSQATIYRSETPNGFYMQLERGQVPGWMQPIDLGPYSPYKMWRVVG